MATSKFQRRHYEAVAKALASTVPSISLSKPMFYAKASQWLDTYDALANMFMDDNPSFNNTSFIDACKWTSSHFKLISICKGEFE